jgi:hypothetical protein
MQIKQWANISSNKCQRLNTKAQPCNKFRFKSEYFYSLAVKIQIDFLETIRQ